MAEERKGRGNARRAVFPADLVKEVEKLPADERRRKLIDYIDQHGEDVPPGGGYGPRIPSRFDDRDPPE